MQAILDQLINKIIAAPLFSEPDLNIYMEEVFDPAVYAEILTRLPSTDKYAFINHPDATRPDGSITRKLLTLSPHSIQTLESKDQAFWTKMNQVLISQELQQALTFKFQDRIRQIYGNHFPTLGNVPILYRDYPGYKIGVHTDAPFKVITLQFYFPKDHSQLHLGTSFHQKTGNSFSLLKTNIFKPNSAYAFVRSEQSWHSVQELAAHEKIRDTLALTIYLREHEEYQRVLSLYGSKDYV